MKNQTLSFSIVLMLSFMLMLAGSYLSSFQNWMKFSQSISDRPLSQPVSPSGIRSISSNDSSEAVITLSYSPLNSPSESTAYIKDSRPVEVVTNPFSETVNIAVFSSSDSKNEINSNSLKPLRAPSFIQYQDELILEFPKDLATESNLKRAISKVLLSSSVVIDSDLLSVESIKSQYKPLFYKKVKNQYGRSIRYPAAANEYAEYLLKNNTKEVVDTEGQFIVVQIPLVDNKLPMKVERYKRWVEDYGSHFKVPTDLIFAIMEVESAFNPRAVSKSNALGLMQIKANAAGKDVFELIDNKSGMPSKTELFDEQNNIRMGIAYMGLLKHEYLQGVRNPSIKEMLSISSYNGGISKTLKLFGKTPEVAILRVNQLHPKQVYRTLRYEHQSDEARRYLDKVLKAKKRYTDLLGLNV